MHWVGVGGGVRCQVTVSWGRDVLGKKRVFYHGGGGPVANVFKHST